ncbi:hypothetical protein HZS_4010 [Henneguya salminicola]|uniref:tRNA-intron lyase n=1 Tax=Henneguya salminicola TaxID=69463 RepID=A0A6G3MGA0_HENSL|nr:hypothetical protein HZS_4010 [Henneguya salminicola]
MENQVGKCINIYHIEEKYYICDVKSFKNLIQECRAYASPLETYKSKKKTVSYIPAIIYPHQINYLFTKYGHILTITESRDVSFYAKLCESVRNLNITDSELENKFEQIINYFSPLYFITDGFKFGCDFLLYVAPPPCCHCLYCVTVYDYEELIQPTEILSKMRSSHTTNKYALFVSNNNQDIIQISFQWNKTIL